MPPAPTTRKRVILLFLGLLLVIAALLTRLGFLMFVRGPGLREQGLSVRLRSIPVAAPRGKILSANGQVLAASQQIFSLYAVPAQVQHLQQEAQTLAATVGLSEPQVEKRLRRHVAFVWLKRRLTSVEVSAVKQLSLPGVGLAPETKRVYPFGKLAGQILGFSGIDNQGLDGVELSYDKLLAGKPGDISVEMDARNLTMARPKRTYTPPVPGDTVKLTLNVGVQKIAGRAVRQIMADTGAKSASVLVMDVKTGGILALANAPNYDPNHYQQYPQRNRRNPVISDTFPPGSTFKILTASAALASGTATPSSQFFDPGSVKVGSARIRCWKRSGHGSVNFIKVVEGSCNVGFVHLGLNLGVSRFYEYLQRFHVTQPTGIDLPGEAKGIIPPAQRVKPVDLATMAFGQTLSLTPIQLLAAVSSVADKGVWRQPHVMSEVLAPDGAVVKTWQGVVSQAIPTSIADQMDQILSGVVARGTGKNARVKGYRLAGKTGTAQAVINGRYVQGKYISSFVGFGPVPNAQIATLVLIQEPSGEYYGGQIAAPVFAKVMGETLALLNVKPNVSLPPMQQVPSLVGEKVESARTRLAKLKLTVRQIGNGGVVLSQFPPGGTSVPPGSQVVLFTGTAKPAKPGPPSGP